MIVPKRDTLIMQAKKIRKVDCMTDCRNQFWYLILALENDNLNSVNFVTCSLKSFPDGPSLFNSKTVIWDCWQCHSCLDPCPFYSWCSNSSLLPLWPINITGHQDITVSDFFITYRIITRWNSPEHHVTHLVWYIIMLILNWSHKRIPHMTFKLWGMVIMLPNQYDA